jgi:hypothetical protein
LACDVELWAQRDEGVSLSFDDGAELLGPFHSGILPLWSRGHTDMGRDRACVLRNDSVHGWTE